MMKIRDAAPADAAAIATMIRELIAFEGTGAEPDFTVEQLTHALAGSPARLHAIVAEDAEGAAGFVSYTIDFALWAGGEVVRIDDVFVRARARGRGVGSALMRRVADIALRENMTCRWEIEPSNLGAQYFYGTLGVDIREKIVARWSEAAMRSALARSLGA
jgi:GNAT superfamily N-acetyltransferase